MEKAAARRSKMRIDTIEPSGASGGIYGMSPFTSLAQTKLEVSKAPPNSPTRLHPQQDVPLGSGRLGAPPPLTQEDAHRLALANYKVSIKTFIDFYESAGNHNGRYFLSTLDRAGLGGKKI